MSLPFSRDAFLDVFAAYNAALWPAVVTLWLVTAGAVGPWMRLGRPSGRVLMALLAVHWIWSGVAYHWLFFSRLNPAALVFGALFTLQGLLFGVLAALAQARFGLARNARGVLGGVFVIYALAYPAIGIAAGLRYPRVPLFAVPCPTTLLTAGWLINATGVPRVVRIIPALWAVIGSTAAIALGIRADWALVAAAVALVIDGVAPQALGARER